MTTPQNPTWYDVLGVSRDASPDEIKAAWRTATDKFEPGSGSGQFRMFSEAADVLLDPSRRAAYDASLDGAAPENAPESAPEPVPEPDLEPAPPPPPGEETLVEEKKPKRTRRPKRERKPREGVQPASRRAVIGTAVLAVLAIAAVVVAGLFGNQVRQNAQIADAREQAPAAAEQAAKTIFGYDYRQLDADKKQAQGYLTPAYAAKYLKAFDLLQKQKDGTPGAAVQTKTTVKSTVLGSGVVDAESDVARVLVYVNLVSTRPNRSPQIFQNRVAMKMVKSGDRWLVDKVDTY
jgi:Mce-associated membrane protein